MKNNVAGVCMDRVECPCVTVALHEVKVKSLDGWHDVTVPIPEESRGTWQGTQWDMKASFDATKNTLKVRLRPGAAGAVEAGSRGGAGGRSAGGGASSVDGVGGGGNAPVHSSPPPFSPVISTKVIAGGAGAGAGAVGGGKGEKGKGGVGVGVGVGEGEGEGDGDGDGKSLSPAARKAAQAVAAATRKDGSRSGSREGSPREGSPRERSVSPTLSST